MLLQPELLAHPNIADYGGRIGELGFTVYITVILKRSLAGLIVRLRLLVLLAVQFPPIAVLGRGYTSIGKQLLRVLNSPSGHSSHTTLSIDAEHPWRSRSG
jgi:hypothetical protein